MKKILVVEDEPEIRDLMINYLSREGFYIDPAEDGVQALSMFEAVKYDLVLLDIMIPKIDGFGVCEVIKERSDTPVVFLSALSDDRSQIRRTRITPTTTAPTIRQHRVWNISQSALTHTVWKHTK